MSAFQLAILAVLFIPALLIVLWALEVRPPMRRPTNIAGFHPARRLFTAQPRWWQRLARAFWRWC